MNCLPYTAIKLEIISFGIGIRASNTAQYYFRAQQYRYTAENDHAISTIVTEVCSYSNTITYFFIKSTFIYLLILQHLSKQFINKTYYSMSIRQLTSKTMKSVRAQSAKIDKKFRVAAETGHIQQI